MRISTGTSLVSVTDMSKLESIARDLAGKNPTRKFYLNEPKTALGIEDATGTETERWSRAHAALLAALMAQIRPGAPARAILEMVADDVASKAIVDLSKGTYRKLPWEAVLAALRLGFPPTVPGWMEWLKTEPCNLTDDELLEELSV